MAVIDAPAPPVRRAPSPAVARPPVARPGPVAPAANGPRSARDPFVDVVRAVGTVGVVLLHWLMAEASWDGRTLLVGNALGHGAGWLVTWLQPLALLFFAAGASAGYQGGAVAAGGRRWAGVVGSRLRAVVRPVLAFAGAWVLAVAGLLALGVPDGAVWRMVRMAPQLLWFLAVWVVLMALTPLLRAAWQRWRWGALGVAVALPLALDALRFGLPGEATGTLSWATVVLAWAAPYLAGVAYAARRSAPHRPATEHAGGRTARLLLAVGAATAVAATAVLVALGPYPPSLIGMPGDEISNLGPPTAPVVAHAMAQVCLVLLFRAALVRRAATCTGRQVVGALARRSMTVYLWHLTAMFAVVGAALLGLGQELPAAWSADWWASRPVWFAAFVLVLLGLVRVFGRFEDRRPTS
ncbi:acyltransferase [Isoptericola sp. 4D.3]|uniref:Acyltransferase n=1 Tax=Isoptericola peretonis TaxID=2918523 RepID=A0ABT0J6K6_9MICO|nr:acyltransferase [Isoptericola sp. 4D.3]